MAQLTDILREWSGGGSKRSQKAPLNRRETLADLARSLPWGRNTDNSTHTQSTNFSQQRKRRESSADSGIKSMRSRRESHTSDFNKMWPRKESPGDRDRDRDKENSSDTSGRRDSSIARALTPPPPKVVGATKKRRDSLTVCELPNFRQEQRPSTSSTASDSMPYFVSSQDSSCQALPPPTIVTSSVTPPATSPTAPPGQYSICVSIAEKKKTKQNRKNNRMKIILILQVGEIQRRNVGELIEETQERVLNDHVYNAYNGKQQHSMNPASR